MQDETNGPDNIPGLSSYRKTADPPPLKKVRRSGAVEALKPLARADVLAAAAATRPVRVGTPPQPASRVSPILRALTIGGVFVAVLGFILGSSFLIGVYDPPAVPA